MKYYCRCKAEFFVDSESYEEALAEQVAEMQDHVLVCREVNSIGTMMSSSFSSEVSNGAIVVVVYNRRQD